MAFGLIPIGFVRFPIRMDWKWVGVDGKGYANTTYISEFHPHVQAGWICQKKETGTGAGTVLEQFLDSLLRGEVADMQPATKNELAGTGAWSYLSYCVF